MNEKHHEMISGKIHISGGEEWYCPMNFDYSPGSSGWRKSISTANGAKRLANLMCKFSVLGKKYYPVARRILAWEGNVERKK